MSDPMYIADYDELIREVLASGGEFRLYPRGTSMLPLIRQGRDSVSLRQLDRSPRKYDILFYQRHDGSYVLHRVIAVGEDYSCVGDNQLMLEPGLRHEQMIAVVSAFSRGNREYSVSHPGYRLYCRLWHWSRPLRRIWRGAKYRLQRILK